MRQNIYDAIRLIHDMIVYYFFLKFKKVLTIKQKKTCKEIERASV